MGGQRPSWSCWRALPEADRAALANPLVAGMTGPLLAWLARHEPAAVAQAAAVLLPKDALRATLLPDAPAVTDRSDASATLLWDVTADDWSPAAVTAAGVDPALLPTVRPSDEIAGTAALPVGEVPVVTGGADTPLALLAAGAPIAQINLGTGAQLLRPGWRPRPVLAPVVHGYADVSGGWYAMAALQNGGSAWQWVCDVLGLGWAQLFEAAAATPAGAGGVTFRPFLTGERGGVARPCDRGGWSGLSPGTTRADLARAAVEGVAFAVAAAFGLLDVPPSDEPVVLTGGGARSRVVRQLLADALGRPVRPLPLRSASAIGAATLAGRGVGMDVVPAVEAADVLEPGTERRAGGRRPSAGRGPRTYSAGAAPSAAGAAHLREGVVVQGAVGGQRASATGAGSAGEVGEPAAGLADDDVERREVPDRHLGLAGDVDRPLGQQAVAPEVAVGPGAPDRPGQVEEPVEGAALLPAGQARVGQARVGQLGPPPTPGSGWPTPAAARSRRRRPWPPTSACSAPARRPGRRPARRRRRARSGWPTRGPRGRSSSCRRSGRAPTAGARGRSSRTPRP